MYPDIDGARPNTLIQNPSMPSTSASARSQSMTPSTGSGAGIPRRRKTKRLTMPKKKRKPTTASTGTSGMYSPVDGEPSMEEFKKMRPCGRIAIPAKRIDGEMYHMFFSVGDDAIVYSTDEMENPDMAWVVRISSIRVEDTAKGPFPWLLVNWYYSANDIANEIKSNTFSANHCSPRERMLSDHTQILSWRKFKEVTYVHEYYEDDLDPPDIDETQFYVRYRYMTSVKNGALEPKVTEHACSKCKVPYNPFPVRPEPPGEHCSDGNDSDSGYASPDRVLSMQEAPDPMHFCPRPSCRKWYHRSCLLKSPDKTKHTIPRGVRLLANDPDNDQYHAEFIPFMPASTPSPSSSRQTSVAITTESSDAPWSIVMNTLTSDPFLPPVIVRVAQQPILRFPHPLGGPRNIIGNIKDVVLARRLCYQLLEGGSQEQLEELETLVNLIGDEGDGQDMAVEETEGENGGGEREGQHQSVFDHIMTMDAVRPLLSLHIPYWMKVEEELKEKGLWCEDGGEKELKVRCPGCKRAI
ncbi:hypothetical protein K474DRAFT_1677258 [Panus rudis PR-1116 ss-1]|nr:hypothetical protein K474DRAFT_1677258 [Panus rudis PR-1116 ss-1]